jgi:hypothetical protein
MERTEARFLMLETTIAEISERLSSASESTAQSILTASEVTLDLAAEVAETTAAQTVTEILAPETSQTDTESEANTETVVSPMEEAESAPREEPEEPEKTAHRMGWLTPREERGRRVL